LNSAVFILLRSPVKATRTTSKKRVAMPYVKVSNISRSVKEENLSELFKCCGEVANLKCVNHQDQMVCIVEFADNEPAEVAISLHGIELGDTNLSVQGISDVEAKNILATSVSTDPAQSDYDKAVNKLKELMEDRTGSGMSLNNKSKRTVYVGNLAEEVTSHHLTKIFSSVGMVTDLKFGGTPKYRYAFVEFATEESAKAAFGLHRTQLAGQTIKVGVSNTSIQRGDGHVHNFAASIKRATEAAKKAADKISNPDGYRDDRNRSRRDRSGRRRSRDRRSRDRGRRRGDRDRGRRRRRRSRSRDRRGGREEEADDDADDNEDGDRFFDGYFWHSKKDHKVDDVQAHVLGIIDTAPKKKLYSNDAEVAKEQQIQDEAARALAALRKFQA